MPDQLLQLGSFVFSVPATTFESLELSCAWEWAEQKRVGGTPALQFTGTEARTISLSGVVFPAFAGGAGQIAKIRALGDAGEPLQLVDGRGRALGRWVIKSLNETQHAHLSDGTPRRQDYTLSLARYD
jgi:phage protein U